MTWYLTGMVLVTSFLFFLFILQTLFLSNKRMDKRMKHFLELHERKKLKPVQWKQLLQMKMLKQKMRSRMRNRKQGQQLRYRLEKAGVPLTPEEFTLLNAMSAGVSGGLFYLVGGEWLLLVVGAILGLVLPKAWLHKKQNERLRKLNEALPDLIATLVGSLRSGFSLPQALKTASEEIEPPLKEEIRTVLTEMKYGSALEDALNDWLKRMPSDDLELMIQAILIQKQVGGNLAEVLDKIVETIRERNRIQRQISTLTAQGKLSGIVIGLLPIILAVALYMIDPTYIGTLFGHPIGMMMLASGLISGIIGFFFIRKITTIEV